MALTTITLAKEQKITYQPLLLAEITLVNGEVLRLSTENLDSTLGGPQYNGFDWKPRIIQGQMSPLSWTSDNGIVQAPQVTLRLADADSFLWDTYETDPNPGFEGAKVRIIFVFYDPATNTFSSDYQVKFVGICNPPQEAGDEELALLFTNIINLSTLNMPTVPIARTCPWTFPSTAAQRQDGADNQDSDFYPCGYSPDASGPNAVGNMDPSTGAPFLTCQFTWEACIARLGNAALPSSSNSDGTPVQIEEDTSGRRTSRFGGIHYDPPLSWRGKAFLSGTVEENINNPNEPKFQDYFPFMYGTAFVEPPVMWVAGEANSTRFEVVLCVNEIVHDDFTTPNPIQLVIVNDFVVPFNNTADPILSWGWVSQGNRSGHVSKASIVNGQGDPYGSLVAIQICVPTKVTASNDIPTVRILTDGPLMRVWSSPDDSAFTRVFTTNPAWALLDALTWTNFTVSDLDLQTFIDAAAVCDGMISYTDLTGTVQTHPRYQIGMVLRQRQAASEVIKNILGLMKGMLAPSGSLDPATSGKMQLFLKQTLADQQPIAVTGSNNSTPILSATAAGADAQGYSAYSFDASNILRKGADRTSPSSLRIQQRPVADTPNKLSLNIQDEDFQYASDSLLITDSEHVGRSGQQISGTAAVEGIVNYDQGKRVIQTQFAEQFRGNPRSGEGGVNDCGGTWIAEFDTSFRAIHLRVGHIIDITSTKFGLVSQLFRVLSVAPSDNFERITIRAQWHEDDWYLDSYGQHPDPLLQSRRRSRTGRLPFGWDPDEIAPMTGDAAYDPTDLGMAFFETYEPDADGFAIPAINVRGFPPVNKFSNLTQPPFAPEGTVSPTGGAMLGSALYFVVVAIDSEGKETPPSFPMGRVTVPAGTTGSVIVPNIYWQSGTVAWKLFGGPNPNRLSLQASGGGTPSSISWSAVNVATEGSPDPQFDHIKVRWRHLAWQGGGTFGFSVKQITAPNIMFHTLPTDPLVFADDFWAGRVVYYASHNQDSSEDIQMMNFIVLSNDGHSFTLVQKDGSTAVDLAALGVEVGDVLYVRAQAYIASATTIGDPLYANPSEQVDPPIALTDASNTAPIIVGINAGHGLLDGDHVLVSAVAGNTAANGAWTITNIDANHIQLDTSVGNGPYENGGLIALVRNGLHPGQYPGKMVRIISGTGATQERKIIGNTNTTLTIDHPWDINPDSTSIFILLDPTWLGEVNGVSVYNSSPDSEITLSIPMKPYIRYWNGDGILFEGLTVGADGVIEATDADSPARDIWVNPGPPGKQQYEKATWNIAPGRSIALGTDVAPHYDVKRVGSPTVVEFKAKIAPVGADIHLDIQVAKADGSYTGTILTAVLVIPALSSDWIELKVEDGAFIDGLLLNDKDTLTVNVLQAGSTVPGKEITIVLKWPIN